MQVENSPKAASVKRNVEGNEGCTEVANRLRDLSWNLGTRGKDMERKFTAYNTSFILSRSLCSKLLPSIKSN